MPRKNPPILSVEDLEDIHSAIADACGRILLEGRPQSVAIAFEPARRLAKWITGELDRRRASGDARRKNNVAND